MINPQSPQIPLCAAGASAPPPAASSPFQLALKSTSPVFRAKPALIRSGKQYADPLDYSHPWPSMEQFARVLALRYDSLRTRHSYYRQLRLLGGHFSGDPALVTEEMLRDYLLHVKMVRHWQPKSIRQALATAQLFFIDQLGHPRWRLFDQVRAKDHDSLPPVLTRGQVKALLKHIRLRRYRTPLKLIYCCGLRLSECLQLTRHDIIGSENKPFRQAQGPERSRRAAHPCGQGQQGPHHPAACRHAQRLA
jgi:integrase